MDARPISGYPRGASGSAGTRSRRVHGYGAGVAATAPPPPPSDIQLLTIPTYDGSGQVTNPDVAIVPSDWSSDRFWLAITPYPGGDANFERPSVYRSADGVAWEVPPGAENPVVSPTSGYLSDPDMLYDPDTRRLWLYYRGVTATNSIYVTTSADGVHWDHGRLLVSAPNHFIVSPTVVRRAKGDWWMFAVNSGRGGCTAASTTLEVRRSQDGLAWSAPVTARISLPARWPWHQDVEWIPSLGQFWMLYDPKVNGSCTTTAVYLATSADGASWKTYPAPVLERGAIPELHDVVYRSSVAYDPVTDSVTLWYSGASYQTGRYVWRAAVERMSRAALFGRVAGLDVLARTRRRPAAAIGR